VSLASLGTVTWRCSPAPTAAKTRYGLGFRGLRASATTSVTLRRGTRRIRTVDAQPGDSVTFPTLGRVQRLEFIQGSGAGTLRATVTARFEAPAIATYCFGYFPPPTTVTISGRR
jgi:hypothetical protein